MQNSGHITSSEVEISNFLAFACFTHIWEFWKKIAEFIEYETPSRFFVKGSAENSVFNERRFISNVLVLRLDARLSC